VIAIPRKLVPSDWAKCIHPKGIYGPLIAVIENSDWLSTSQEPITFLECVQRAQDVQKWLEPK
jgi:hypothetical protein